MSELHINKSSTAEDADANNNLELIRTEFFENIAADIYRCGDEIYMTAGQLCDCLGEGRSTFDSRISRNEYLRDPGFSVSCKLQGADGKLYSTRLFTEDGVYEITMLSKSPKGQEFRAWIRGVIKSIRKHGAYMTPARIIESLRRPEGMMVLLQELLDEQLENAELRAQVSDLRPKADFADAVAESNNCVTFGEMAKILRQNGLPYGRTRMCEELREDGFLIRQDCADYNTPSQRAMERCIFYHCKHVSDTPGGFRAATNVTRVTGKGQQVLLQHFKRKRAIAGELAA